LNESVLAILWLKERTFWWSSKKEIFYSG
jgi:hypothetical protein